MSAEFLLSDSVLCFMRCFCFCSCFFQEGELWKLTFSQLVLYLHLANTLEDQQIKSHLCVKPSMISPDVSQLMLSYTIQGLFLKALVHFHH